MKNTISIVLLVMAFMIFASYRNQNPQWKGTIEEEDGVKVIINPNEPLYGEIKFDLEEDLRIGNLRDDKYLFWRLRDVDVDSKGNIFALDMSNYRIQKYDSSGRYLMTIGRYGQGPGEFEWPNEIEIDVTSGNIFVIDRYTTVEIFDKNGVYINSFSLGHSTAEICPIDGTYLWAVLRKYSEQTVSATSNLCLFNLKGEMLETVAEYSYNPIYKHMGDGNFLSAKTGYELSICIAGMGNGNFVYGYSKEYVLNVMDRTGKILHKIRKEEPYPKFSNKEKEAYRLMPVPKFKPFFYSLYNDDKGRLYVQRNKQKWSEVNVEKIVDVFSNNGTFLYITTLPANTCAIYRGFIYSFEVNEESGLEYVQRYKIKNWDEIKEH